MRYLFPSTGKYNHLNKDMCIDSDLFNAILRSLQDTDAKVKDTDAKVRVTAL